MTTNLHPDLLDVLAAVDRGEVRRSHLGERRMWVVGRRPNTPAVECLLDAGLVEEDRECVPPLAVTDAGRALLDTPNTDTEA